MDIQIFKRYPLYPKGVQVSEENKDALAEWCGGTVVSVNDGASFYIQVPVLRPFSKRQSRAMVGDHILRLGGGFKVYTPQGMLKSFRNATAAEMEADEDLADSKKINEAIAQERSSNESSKS